MNKKIAVLWLICFFLLLLLPQVVWAADKERFATEATENIVATEMPELTKENYREFSGIFESYFNNNIPFRSQMITFSSLADMTLFQEKTVNDKVVIGQNNWLFYSEFGNMENYKGTNLYTREELELIADNLITSKAYLDQRGIEFVLFLAPNKEAVYGEGNLPSYYRAGEITRAKQLTDYLQENTDIRVVYPLEEMIDHKDEYFLYWHYDTHWNVVGGYIGGSALLRELGIRVPPMEEIVCIPYESSGYDLARMMNLQKYYEEKMPADNDYIVVGYERNNVRTVRADGDGAFLYHSDSPNSKKLFMVRDSFASGMADVLASNFQDSYMPHWDSFFEQSQIEEQQPDVFVLEMVERGMDYLLTFRLSE